MNSGPRYFVQIEGQVNGPYRVEQLRELAVGAIIKPASLAAPTADGPWVALATLPEAAVIFPPRAAVGFKEGHFEAINERGGRGVDMNELLAAAQTEGPILRAPGASPPADATKPAALNEVQQMVRSVQAKEAAFAPPLPLPRKPEMSRSFKWVLALSALLILTLGGIRLGYASRWDETSTLILMGWGVLGHVLLVGVYFLFRRTEG